MTVSGGVAWITLGSPWLDDVVCGEIVAACERVEEDDARVAVVVPAGADFSLGLPAGMRWLPASWPDPVAAVAGVTKPVVAGLVGRAVGWGAALALACDLRVAAGDATLGFPQAEQGGLPGGGATQRLTRMVGVARASELLLLGEPIEARRLAAWGVVRRVVPSGRLRSTVAALASSVAARGPQALAYAKEAVTRALDLPLADGLHLEHDLYALLQTTEDRREGVAAFLERRQPGFRNR